MSKRRVRQWSQPSTKPAHATISIAAALPARSPPHAALATPPLLWFEKMVTALSSPELAFARPAPRVALLRKRHDTTHILAREPEPRSARSRRDSRSSCYPEAR